jgi:uncharacterized membrane protein YccF (DUF307 family)
MPKVVAGGPLIKKRVVAVRAVLNVIWLLCGIWLVLVYPLAGVIIACSL